MSAAKMDADSTISDPPPHSALKRKKKSSIKKKNKKQKKEITKKVRNRSLHSEYLTTKSTQ